MMNFFFSDDVRRDPYVWYEQARSASPVLHDPRSDMWMLFDYASVKRAMDEHTTFSSRVHPPTGAAPDWLVFMDPPRHTAFRAIVSRAFTPRALAGMEPRIRQISRTLLDQHVNRGEMELVSDYAMPLPVLVIAELMGIAGADRDTLIGWSNIIVNLSYSIAGGELAARVVREYMSIREEMRTYVATLVEQRLAHATDDLLSRIVHGEAEGKRLSLDDILGFFVLLLSAATETTTNLIDNAMISFIDNPDQLTRLRSSPELMPLAIEEIVRYRSPGQAFFRETTCDVELHGRTIPRGKFVLLMVGSANRDPLVFDQPDRFDVARNPNPHIAFGHGIHHCIGSALARLEASVAIPDLITRLGDVQHASAEPWEPRQALHVHGPLRLPIRFSARQPVA